MASKQDNIKRGVLRDGKALTHDSAVRSITSRIDLVTGQEDLLARVDHDDAGIASTALFGPRAITSMLHSRAVAKFRCSTCSVATRLSGLMRGAAGLAISPDGSTLYVHNYMDRSVSVHDLTEVLTGASSTVALLASYDTVANETLSSDVLLGKQHFYDSRDARLALQKYISCAACHNDGGHDGRVWDFTGFDEGLRNTIDLRGHGGMDHGPLHWSANFDEVQDFEGQLRAFSFGVGLMNNTYFNAGTRAQSLGDPKAGLSGDLDALAAYVDLLTSYPRSPHRTADGSLTASAVSGQSVFLLANCDSCHAGDTYTDSAPNNLHDVGTIKSTSGKRLGALLTGIDTPTLRSIWTTAGLLFT